MYTIGGAFISALFPLIALTWGFSSSLEGAAQRWVLSPCIAARDAVDRQSWDRALGRPQATMDLLARKPLM